MDRMRIALLGAVVLTCLLFSSSVFAKFPFVNDFEAFPLESQWRYSYYYDIVIDESDIVTVLWMSHVINPKYNTFPQLYYRRFDLTGIPLTETKMISDSSKYSLRSYLDIGHNRRGKWVVTNLVLRNCPGWPMCETDLMAWMSDDQGMYADSGFRVGDQVLPVASNILGSSGVDSVGNFVIAWVNCEIPMRIYCQLFWADKTPRTDTIRISTSSRSLPYPTYNATNPKAAMTPGGDFVVIWDAMVPNDPPMFTGEWNVFFRLFHPDGTPKTDEICATCDGDSTYSWANLGKYGDVAIADNGDFAITFTQPCAGCGCYTQIGMRRFNADGTPKGQQLILDSLLCYYNNNLTSYVASDSAGNLLVTWQDDKAIHGFGNILARRFNSDGESVGSHFYRINDENNVAELQTSPVDLNNQGLAAFFWVQVYNWNGVEFYRMQLMDMSDVGIYVCGDANNDHLVDVSDAVYLIQYIFSSGQGPVDLCLGDSSGDGVIDISDAVALISYIFQGGSLPSECLG